jgi:hypothetical protein
VEIVDCFVLVLVAVADDDEKEDWNPRPER